MAKKPIQEQFGQTVIDAIGDFARADVKTPDALEADEFAHVSSPVLRRRLAEVFYGVRWIYKLGLALLTENVERAAHIRAQIVDYASITEGLLADALAHAIRHGHTVGTGYTFRDPDTQKLPIRWNAANPEPLLRKQSLWWMIRIAHEFGVINKDLADKLDWLREQRNSVHLQGTVSQKSFLHESMRAYGAVQGAIKQTQKWKNAHP